ncbi:MAG: ABC transporter permease subunit [Pseudomonadales bacterium]|nr:ABC transporter permease subunit [Pseudomonadales bacterium]
MINSVEASAQQRRRNLLDRIATGVIATGGIWVILIIVLLFFYLLAVVAPIFKPASMVPQAHYSTPAPERGSTIYLAVEESKQLGVRVTASGAFVFFGLTSGEVTETHLLDLPAEVTIDSIASADIDGRFLNARLSDGSVIILQIGYRVTFAGDKRVLKPSISYPYGNEPLTIELDQRATHRDLVVGEESVVAVFSDLASRQVSVALYEVEEGDELTEPDLSSNFEAPFDIDYQFVDGQARWLYLANRSGQVTLYDLSDIEEPELVANKALLSAGVEALEMRLLLGGSSLLVGDQLGNVYQFSITRDVTNQYGFAKYRQFKLDSSVQTILPEERRKGFIGISGKGQLSIFHTTAEQKLLSIELLSVDSKNAVTPLYSTYSPRSDTFMMQAGDGVSVYEIDNHHPEISWSALWNEVWYEGYEEPEFIWQSSSADNDFEPKFSLIPVSFGTLKAAFYAMIFATPLAIFGAIFTAYFMAPQMRAWVKPSIEIMEALPTVILGFLAGLWLAPLVEDNLLAVVSVLLVMPFELVLFAWIWHILPASMTQRIPDGWQAAVLIPVIILCVWVAFALAPVLELWFFGGNIQTWMRETLGINYDQRNSLVVGLAMGLAVIPTIFSITEDAIFSVPKHLTQGSLALGATPWQTLTKVVILTASPGIFSAVMIGLGRAVGETMIVLMATGNTPVMDFSVFQGMRTLSANIAVELPESEVDSSHYRILFLAALVLFAVTFFFNTIAEVVRQNLRKRYGNL